MVARDYGRTPLDSVLRSEIRQRGSSSGDSSVPPWTGVPRGIPRSALRAETPASQPDPAPDAGSYVRGIRQSGSCRGRGGVDRLEVAAWRGQLGRSYALLSG